jgi:hypothetical protein
MTRIKLAIVLVVSNVCLSAIASGGLFSERARAEAPIPKSGCWSREIAIAPTAEAQVKITIQGRVVAIERNDKDRSIAAKDVVTWISVITTSGEEKSVYLGSDRSLRQQYLRIKERDVLEIQGVQMPKAKKPTLVATSIKKGDRIWKIANFTDKPIGAKSCRYNG